MKDWNGREVLAAQSKGGVRVVAHPLDNLIVPGCSPWPVPEVIQKLYQSRHVCAFTAAQRSICISGVGYYCDLQSLNSEDAITWSVFGTVARAPRRQREAWLEELFTCLHLPEAQTSDSEIFLWRRVPHPDTLVPGGPEIDVGIITRNALVLGEAKWRSSVGTGQGKKKNKTQIQLRGEFLKKYASRLIPSAHVKAVVGIGLVPNTFVNNVPKGISFREVTWAKICSLPSHPNAAELKRYFEWKKRHSRSIRGIAPTAGAGPRSRPNGTQTSDETGPATLQETESDH